MSGDISNSCLCGDAFIFYHSTAPPEKRQVPSSPAASFRPSRHTLRFGLGVWESTPEAGAAERPRKAALSLLTPTDTPLPPASRARPRAAPCPRPSLSRAPPPPWGLPEGGARALAARGRLLEASEGGGQRAEVRAALGLRGCGDGGSGSASWRALP